MKRYLSKEIANGRARELSLWIEWRKYVVEAEDEEEEKKRARERRKQFSNRMAEKKRRKREEWRKN